MDPVDLVEREDRRRRRRLQQLEHEPIAAARLDASRPRRARRRPLRAACRVAASTIRRFIRCIGLWIPGVSMNTIWPPAALRTPTMRWRVVCGLSETIATFWPTNRLSSVDLPAFGRPTSETNPAFTSRPRRPAAAARADADLVDAAPLGLEDLDVEAVDRRTARRRPARGRRASARSRRRSRTRRRRSRRRAARPCSPIADLAAEDERVVGLAHDRLGFEVVLVANLADELLDDVLDGDQAGGAAVLVDDDRELEAAAAGTRAGDPRRAWFRARTPPAA